MESPSDRLRQARALKYPSARKAAEAIGVNYQTYTAHENGNRGLKRDAAIRYARFFKVSLNWLLTGGGEMIPGPASMVYNSQIPVKGYVQAGIWREVDGADGDQLEGTQVPSHPLKPADNQFALQVRGDSMNEIVSDGQFVQCIPLEHCPGGPENGDIVVVRRIRDGGQIYEDTLKQIEFKRGNGGALLWARSTNDMWKDPIPYKNSPDSSVEIIAVVLGAFVNFRD